MGLNNRFLNITLISVLGLGPLLWAQQAFGAQNVEIFVQGKKYNSIEEYREEEKRNITIVHKKQSLDEFQIMLEQVISRSRPPLELTFGSGQIKKFYFKDFLNARPEDKTSQDVSLSKDQTAVADPFARSYETIQQVGFNAGVDHVVNEFAVGKDRSAGSEKVSAKDLDKALKETSVAYDGPLLLMSDQNKIKVMALEPTEGKDAGTAKVSDQ
jgi:hypothetical protein